MSSFFNLSSSLSGSFRLLCFSKISLSVSLSQLLLPKVKSLGCATLYRDHLVGKNRKFAFQTIYQKFTQLFLTKIVCDLISVRSCQVQGTNHFLNCNRIQSKYSMYLSWLFQLNCTLDELVSLLQLQQKDRNRL